MPNGEALRKYLEQVRYIRGSNLASEERSYYPALAALFTSIGETLNLPVLAIHQRYARRDRGKRQHGECGRARALRAVTALPAPLQPLPCYQLA